MMANQTISLMAAKCGIRTLSGGDYVVRGGFNMVQQIQVCLFFGDAGRREEEDVG